MERNGSSMKSWHPVKTERKFYKNVIRPNMWYRILGYKEISFIEDECSRDAHTSLDTQ